MDLKLSEQFVSTLVPGKKRFLDMRRVNRVSIERERERDGGREKELRGWNSYCTFNNKERFTRVTCSFLLV